MNKTADIVIISYNTCELTLQCIKSIYATSSDNIQNIIVVDNNSNDNTIEKIKKSFPDVKIIANDDNSGYGKAANIGVKESNTDYIIISNPDVIYHEHSIKKLLETFDLEPDCGICGPAQIFPNGKYQRSYGDLPGIKLAFKDILLITHIANFIKKVFHSKKIKEVPYLDGAVLAIEKAIFDNLNGFDEDYFFYTEEADLCFRINKSGKKVIHNPVSVVTHLRGATESKKVDPKRIKMLIHSKAIFCDKHFNKLSSKIFFILEIFYSFNLFLIFIIISLVPVLSKKIRHKAKIYKLFGSFWIDELNNLLEDE